MWIESTLYALVQVAHNFGAVAVVGAPAAALYFRPAAGLLRPLAWLMVAGWLVQLVSGAGFGAASYWLYQALPELHWFARAALAVKILCALAGIALGLHWLLRGDRGEWRPAPWRAQTALGATALLAAAFLRWFS